MGERFFVYLRSKGLSQRKVSDLSRVAMSTVSRFCSGASISSDSLLRLISVCDDLSLDWLFYSTGEMIRSRDGNTTMNFGTYAGADVVQGSKFSVKDSTDVRVGSHSFGVDLVQVVTERDRSIARLNEVISERDRTISGLYDRLRSLGYEK